MTFLGDDNWFTCPHCSAVVPGDADVCPECGSCDETGWSQDAAFDDLDLPSGHEREERPIKTKAAFWQVVAVIVLIMLILLVLGGVF